MAKKKKSIFKRWWFWVFIVPLTIVFIMVVYGVIRWNMEGKSPNSFCSTSGGCIDGLFCKEICFDAHGGSCLPFGACKENFCSLVGGPSAEQGYRYKCNDGTYGCFIKQINYASSFTHVDKDGVTKNPQTICNEKDGTLEETGTDTLTCFIEDPEVIKDGQCSYYNCGTDECPI